MLRHGGEQDSQKLADHSLLLPDIYLGISPDFQPDPGESSHSSSQPYITEAELQSLIQAFPTKADIVVLIEMVKAAHRK